MAVKTKLRLAREAEGWTQERLIREIRREATRLRVSLPDDASLKVYVSRWESGHTRVTKAEYRTLFRLIYTATDGELGFELAASPPEQPTTAAPAHSLAMDGEVLDYYSGVLKQHVHGDNLLGAPSVLRAAEQQASALTEVLSTLPAEKRRTLAQLVCRYHEFLGWLHQDVGDTARAMHLTDRAMDYGLEIDDPGMSAYLLMRKSNIASDAGAHDLAAVLAEAAQRLARPYPRLHAVTLRQKANACAAVGDEPGCLAALELGFEVVEADDPIGLELAPYCTSEYFAMEAAACLTKLRKPDQAVYTLQRGMSSWTEPFRRDKGISLARLASAQAQVGDVDGACETAGQAVNLVSATGSARGTRELQHARSALAPWRRREDVRSVARAIAELIGRAS